jgi:hypothetical protein
MRKRDSFITSTRFPSDGIRVERTFETGREIDLLTKSRCHEVRMRLLVSGAEN